MSYQFALEKGSLIGHCQASRHTNHFLPKLAACLLCQNMDQNLASLWQWDNFGLQCGKNNPSTKTTEHVETWPIT